MRQAYASGYIDDAQVWMDMIDTRNAFSHDYDGHFFTTKEDFLRGDAFAALSRAHQFFTTRI
jgi:hypothetical protein